MNIPSPTDIAKHYRNKYKKYLLTWGMYFHYGVFDKSDDFALAKERTLDIVAQMAKLSPSCRVLDIGCGIGSSCLYLVDKFRCSIEGIDPVKEEVDFAKKRAKQISDQIMVDFHLGKAEEIPFDDCTYDVVMSNEALCHVADRLKALRECYRVLKPGGRFVFSDLLDKLSKITPETEYFYTYLRQSLSENLESYKMLLRKVNFTILEVRDYSSEIPKNYQKSLSLLEKNREEVVKIVGKKEYKETMEFYTYCLTEPICKNIGWAIFSCVK